MSIATLVSKKLYPRINRRRTILFIFALALCLAGIAAHIHLRNSSQDYTGPLALLDRVFDLSLVLGLSIVMLALGRAVCRRFRLDFTSTAEDLSFSLFLGTGVAGLSVLCLGLVGLLRAWPIAMLFAAFLLLTRAELPQLFEVILAGIQRAVSTAEGRLLTLLFVCLATILLLRAATPPHAYDEAIYHLAATRQFVEQGRVFPSYDNSMGNQPFLVHMIYAVCLIAKSDIAAKLFSLFLGISTALALYGFCSRFLTRRVGVIALFAFFAAGMVVEVAVTARIDVSLAGMLFLATYSMINYLETERHGWLCVSALFAGFSLGIKHSAGMWLLFVGAMYIVERLIRRREHFATVLRRGFGYMCIAAAIASPWYVKNYVWFHNPLYPFLIGEVADFGPQGVRYFNIDDERKLDAHFDLVRRELPEVVKAQESVVKHAVDLRLQRHAMRPWEFFIRPNTYLVADFRHYPNYLFLVIPLLFFLRRPKWIVWLLVMSTGFFLFP